MTQQTVDLGAALAALPAETRARLRAQAPPATAGAGRCLVVRLPKLQDWMAAPDDLYVPAPPANPDEPHDP